MTSTDSTSSRPDSIGTGPVISLPDAGAATPEALLPRAADHYALFQDVAGEELEAWTVARSFAPEVLPRIDDCWDRAE